MLGLSKSRSASGKWYNDASTALNRVLPSLVHDYANQRFYNSVDGETSFPFTATRTTNAMQFDSQGRAVWAPVQLCTRGQDFLSWSGIGAEGTIALSGNTAPTGAPAYLMTYTVANPTFGLSLGNQVIVLGAPHTYSLYMRYVNHQWARIVMYSLANTANQIRAFVDLQNKVIGVNGASGTATYIGGSVIDVGDGWVRVTISGNVPFTTAGTDANILVSTCTGDGVTTRAGNGAAIEIASAVLEPWDANAPHAWRSEFNTSGSAWYGPRFDYDPATGQALGLLVEDARTNLVASSLNLVPTNIAELAVTRSASPSTYLGGWSAVRLTSDGTNNAHGAYPTSLSPTASSTVGMQAIVKPISGGTFYQLTGSGNWLLDLNGYANFDLSGNGSVTATGSSASNPFIRHLGNGVYHIGVSVAASAAPSSGAACLVGLITTGTDLRLPMNTSTAVFDFIYGAVFQSASGWCSVVPTFGTSATRAADTVSVATGSWLDATKGTMYVDFMRGFVATGSGNACAMARLYSDTTNYVSFLSGSGTHSQHRVDTLVGGVAQAQISTSTGGAQMTRRKMAGSYIANLFKASENGVAGTDDTAGTIPTITTLAIGTANVANTAIAGWVREFRYYRTADATSTQLQNLTA